MPFTLEYGISCEALHVAAIREELVRIFVWGIFWKNWASCIIIRISTASTSNTRLPLESNIHTVFIGHCNFSNWFTTSKSSWDVSVCSNISLTSEVILLVAGNYCNEDTNTFYFSFRMTTCIIWPQQLVYFVRDNSDKSLYNKIVYYMSDVQIHFHYIKYSWLFILSFLKVTNWSKWGFDDFQGVNFFSFNPKYIDLENKFKS